MIRSLAVVSACVLFELTELMAFVPRSSTSLPVFPAPRRLRVPTFLQEEKNPSFTSLFSSVSDDKSLSSSEAKDLENDELISSAFEDANSKIEGEPIPYEKLTIGIMKETFPGENRVSITPESAERLVNAGFHVVVEVGGESHCDKCSYKGKRMTSLDIGPISYLYYNSRSKRVI